MDYYFFGNFTTLRPEIVIWRLKMVNELLNLRRSSLDSRIKLGMITPGQKEVAEQLFINSKIMILLTSDDDKAAVKKGMESTSFDYNLELYSLKDMFDEIQKFDQQIS